MYRYCMASLRHLIPISRKLFSLLEKMEEYPEIPCTHDPDLFHPTGSEKAIREDTAKAKALCQTCPIIDQCRMYALEAKEPYGIWGGFDEKDRQEFYKAISSRYRYRL